MAEKFEAIVFDLDGLLVDTEAPGLETFRQSCIKFGLEPLDDIYIGSLGLDYKQGVQYFRRELDELVNFAEFLPYWEGLFTAQLKSPDLALMPGASEILQALSKTQATIAVATSSSQQGANTKMRNAGIDQYFDCVVTGDDVERGKPDPAIYQKALNKLGASPAASLALEDSDNGVSAAIAAGMQVFHVPGIAPAGEVSQHASVQVFESLFSVLEHLSIRN